MLAPLASRYAGGRLGVEEPGPVQVHPQAQLSCRGGDRREVLERKDPASGGVVRVLQAQEFRPREMHVLGPDGGAKGVRGDGASFAGQGSHLYPGEYGRGAGLVDEDVGALVQEHLVARARPDEHPALVAQRARRRVQGGLLAEQGRHVLLQTVYRRVLPEDVVPQRGLEHGPPHPLRRPGHGVAAKIYHEFPPSLSSVVSSTCCVMEKCVLATSANPSSPRSRTTRRAASRTCVEPRGSSNPTRSESMSISSRYRARARIEAAATAASSSALGRTSSRKPPGTRGSRYDRAFSPKASTTATSTSSLSSLTISAFSSASSRLTLPPAAARRASYSLGAREITRMFSGPRVLESRTPISLSSRSFSPPRTRVTAITRGPRYSPFPASSVPIRGVALGTGLAAVRTVSSVPTVACERRQSRSKALSPDSGPPSKTLPVWYTFSFASSGPRAIRYWVAWSISRASTTVAPWASILRRRSSGIEFTGPRSPKGLLELRRTLRPLLRPRRAEVPVRTTRPSLSPYRKDLRRGLRPVRRGGFSPSRRGRAVRPSRGLSREKRRPARRPRRRRAPVPGLCSPSMINLHGDPGLPRSVYPLFGGVDRIC